MTECKNFEVFIPRLALNGGNVITLQLAIFLSRQGHNVTINTGFKKIEINETNLPRLRVVRKGMFNLPINLFVYFISGFCANFSSKTLIFTHHLTKAVYMRRKAHWCLVQDREIDFYPRNVRWLGENLWSHYLAGAKLIFTNRHLEAEVTGCSDGLETQGCALPDLQDFQQQDPSYPRKVDILMLLRKGAHKNAELTYNLGRKLAENGYKVTLVSFLDSPTVELRNLSVIKQLNREDFAKLLKLSKCFVCLTKIEGLGLPNLEAAVSGCIVVTTPIPSYHLLKNLGFKVVEINLKKNLSDTINLINNLMSQEYTQTEIDYQRQIQKIKQTQYIWLKYTSQALTDNG